MLSLLRSVRTMSLLLFIGALSVPGSFVLAQLDEAPFEWDHTFASPGTSMSVEVLQTMSGPPRGTVSIIIKSTGFAGAVGPVALWQRTGAEYSKYEPAVGEDGTVQFIPGVDAMMLGGYIRGQPFDIAIVDEATNKRAQTKLIPFPITAEGDGGCQASAEVVTGTGLVWLVTLTGYSSGEQVTITSVSKKETLTNDVAASGTGEIAFPILYPKRSKGNAQVTVEGSGGCHVNLDFAIGKSALKAK